MKNHQSIKEFRAAIYALRAAFTFLVIVLGFVGLMLLPVAIFGTEEDMQHIFRLFFGV